MRSSRNLRPLRALSAAIFVAGITAACVPPPAPTPAPGTVTVFATDPNLLEADISADGRYLALELVDESDDFTRAITVTDRADGSVVELPVSGYYPMVSDDGASVAMRRWPEWNTPGETSVRLWDRSSNATPSLPQPGGYVSGFLTAPSISADGDVVAWSACQGVSPPCGIFTGDAVSNVFVHLSSTGTTEQITDFTPDAVNSWIPNGTIADVEVSRDGRFVVYSTTRGIPGSDQGPAFANEILIWERATGETRTVIEPDWVARQLSISSDGSRIAYETRTPGPGPDADATFDIEVVTIGSGDPTGTLLDLDHTRLGHEENQGTPVLSPDGSMLYYSTGEVEMYLEPTLVGTHLVAIELDGDFEARRRFDASHLSGAFEDGNGQAALVYGWSAGVVQAWHPRG